MNTFKEDDFKLTFEVTIIEHLGLNLYSEVHSALSELIANAYDAEARNVEVVLPIDVPLGLQGQTITIRDDGHGMTYEECRDKYLRMGRNRRRSSRMSKNGERRVIGKKGIGKLAGFGVAERLRIRTVAERKLTEFFLDLNAIREAEAVDAQEELEKGVDAADLRRIYRPDIYAKDKPVDEENGTTVTLSHLRSLDEVEWDDFMSRLSRKFAIFGDDFRVVVRKAGTDETRVVEKFDIECQFRFPDDGWSTETVKTPSGNHQVKYWIGFQKSTIKESAARGISVLASGKSVQDPFDFQLTGGTRGQFGLQYMTGEVVADWLDDQGVMAVDVVASDRASVRWSNPSAQKLLEWGKGKVKELLGKWVELRAKKTVEEIKELDPEIEQEIESYEGAAKKELRKVIDQVVSTISYVGTKRTKEVVGSIVLAYRHQHVKDVLLSILESRSGVEAFGRALEAWDLIEAVLTYQRLQARLTAIYTLKALVLGKANEVKTDSEDLSLHEHLAKHPYLIDPMYSEFKSERSVDKFILEKYGEDPKDDDKRFDFIVTYSSGEIKVIEIKSAKRPVDERGLRNLMDYHRRIKDAERKHGGGKKVSSLLSGTKEEH